MMNKVEFIVNDLPPKKDGANSMWRKPAEIPRIISLRLAAWNAIKKFDVPLGLIHMKLWVHAQPHHGDLDNFITGICDGLMAAHPLSIKHVQNAVWADLPAPVAPDKHILFEDDAMITKIEAERIKPDNNFYYELTFEWLP